MAFLDRIVAWRESFNVPGLWTSRSVSHEWQDAVGGGQYFPWAEAGAEGRMTKAEVPRTRRVNGVGDGVVNFGGRVTPDAAGHIIQGAWGGVGRGSKFPGNKPQRAKMAMQVEEVKRVAPAEVRKADSNQGKSRKKRRQRFCSLAHKKYSLGATNRIVSGRCGLRLLQA